MEESQRNIHCIFSSADQKHSGSWLSREHGSAELMVGLHDLRGLSQPVIPSPEPEAEERMAIA